MRCLQCRLGRILRNRIVSIDHRTHAALDACFNMILCSLALHPPRFHPKLNACVSNGSPCATSNAPLLFSAIIGRFHAVSSIHFAAWLCKWWQYSALLLIAGDWQENLSSPVHRSALLGFKTPTGPQSTGQRVLAGWDPQHKASACQQSNVNTIFIMHQIGLPSCKE